MSRIRFVTKDYHTHLYLDDKEVDGCVQANFDYEVNAIPIVTLKLYARDIEVESDEADIHIVNEESIESIGLPKGIVNILHDGFWYNRNGERKVDPVLTVAKLLEEYNAGRLIKYKGLGAHRYAQISYALKRRGLVK